MSAQQVVEKAAVFSRRVTVRAAELPQYIKSLPRLLTEELIVEVEQGTVPQTLELKGFYGSGRLVINGAGSVLNGGLKIDLCSAALWISRFEIRGTCSDTTNAKFAVYMSHSSCVALEQFSINGSKNAAYGDSLTGVCCNNCSLAQLSQFQISDMNKAVLVSGASIASIQNFTAMGNQTGAHAYAGGVILLSGSTPELLGGVSNEKQGGIIAKADGTVL